MTNGQPIDEGRKAILTALERHEVLYVVIGGAAAQARGWLEPTDDIDVTPERSEGNLVRLAAAVEELDAGFRVDPVRYPEGYRPPDGIDARTFRNQVSITFTTRHGDFDVVLIPDGTSGYGEIAATATPETVPGTGIVVPVASAEMILHSKGAANRPKDRAVIQSMRTALGLGD